MMELERFVSLSDCPRLKNCLYYAGAYFVLKKAVNLVWDISNGLKSYVFPKVFSINYKEKYGEWAVITGCTQGIGKCYAEELAQKGMNIVLISRNKSKLEEVATELSKKYGKNSIDLTFYSTFLNIIISHMILLHDLMLESLFFKTIKLMALKNVYHINLSLIPHSNSFRDTDKDNCCRFCRSGRSFND